MPPRVPLSVLRPVWWGLALFPPLASLLPWFAPLLSWTWLWVGIPAAPLFQLAVAAGLPWQGWWVRAFPLVAGVGVGLLLELAMRAVGRRRGVWRSIRRRTAVGVAIASAALALGILGWRPREGRFYASPGFSVTERGLDGDHYLLVQAPGDDVVWLWMRQNF